MPRELPLWPWVETIKVHTAYLSAERLREAGIQVATFQNRLYRGDELDPVWHNSPWDTWITLPDDPEELAALEATVRMMAGGMP
jgi:hypothetical protein